MSLSSWKGEPNRDATPNSYINLKVANETKPIDTADGISLRSWQDNAAGVELSKLDVQSCLIGKDLAPATLATTL